jgi:hypothetical protein
MVSSAEMSGVNKFCFTCELEKYVYMYNTKYGIKHAYTTNTSMLQMQLWTKLHMTSMYKSTISLAQSDPYLNIVGDENLAKVKHLQHGDGTVV